MKLCDAFESSITCVSHLAIVALMYNNESAVARTRSSPKPKLIMILLYNKYP